MPRNGSGVMSKPAGTTAVPGTSIEAAKYNATVDDIIADLNTPRPVVAGGTGASTAAGARTNLGLEALDDIPDYFRQPFKAPITLSYDPETLSVHTGPLMYDSTETRLWRVYSEALSHAPENGMSVYAEYSDDIGATWRGRRAIYAGRTDRKVLAMTGRYIDGRLLVIVNTEDAGLTRYLDMVYSDDGGATWTTTAITVSGSIQNFLYGPLNVWPAVAGGNDTQGALFYTYTNNKSYAFRTSNKGATWSSEIEVFASTDSYLDGVGSPTTGYNVNEHVVLQVSGQAKFVHYLRGDNEANLLVATSTDMVTLTGARDSGIENEGPSLDTGTPPYLLERDGEAYLYTFGRENWVDFAPDREQKMLFYRMNASDLYDAGGLFSSTTPRVAAVFPNRLVGMMFHAEIDGGVVAHIRAGESVFSNNANAATSQIYMMSSIPIPANALRVRDNLADNPDFAVAVRGTSFTGLTAAEPVIDRWRVFCSGSTMTAAIEAVNPIFTNSLPHRPYNAMRITATADDLNGIQQAFYGPSELSRFADKEITVSFYGVGALPSGLRLAIVFDYGTAGSADVSITSAFEGGASAVGRMTYTSATARCPTIEGKTITSDAGVYIRIDKTSTDLWNFAFAGIKIEDGTGATLMRTPLAGLEALKCRRYFMELPAGHATFRESSTLSVAAVSHPPMAKLPTLGGVNLTTGFTIDHLAGLRAITGITIDRQEDTGLRLNFAHASDTTFTVGLTYRSTGGSRMFLDAEV